MRIGTSCLLAIATALTACGGGGGSDATSPAANVSPPAQATHAYAAYAGRWATKCSGMGRVVLDIRTAPGNTLELKPSTESYAHKDCQGAVIATHSYNVARVATPTGTAIAARISALPEPNTNQTLNLFDIAIGDHADLLSGSGVSQRVVDGKTQHCIGYPDMAPMCSSYGTVRAGFTLRGESLHLNGNHLVWLIDLGGGTWIDRNVYTKQ